MDRRLWLTFPLSCAAVVAVALAPRWAAGDPVPAPAPPVPAPPVPAPSGDAPVTVTAVPDRAITDAASREVRVRVELTAQAAGPSPRTPTDLVVVLDRSGSMSGAKLRDAQDATEALVGLLGPQDRFALVSFSSEATVDLPLAEPPPGWRGVVEGLRATGSTDLLEGLERAGEVVGRVPGRATRVVVLSDGHPDDAAGLVPAVSALMARDVPVSAIGIGDDWDEQLMGRLADAGAGNLHWVRQGTDLQQVLAAELDATSRVVAQAASLRVDGPVTLLGAAGYPVVGQEVRLGSVVGGQHRGLWLTLAVDRSVSGTVDLGALSFVASTPDGARHTVSVDLPAVRIEADAAVAYAALGDAWADAVVQEAWNELRRDVAARVQRGDESGATAAIDGYRRRYALVNGYAQNPILDDNLSEADTLAQDVHRQFVGEDQTARRNLWSKGNVVDASQKQKGLP